MNQQKDKFGETSIDDVKQQMNMYQQWDSLVAPIMSCHPLLTLKMDETGMGNSWVTKHMLHCVTSQTELQTRNFYSDNKFGISNLSFYFV